MSLRMKSLVVIALVLGLSAVASAAGVPGSALPAPPASEKNVWYIDWDWNNAMNTVIDLNGIATWNVQNQPGGKTAPARTFNSASAVQGLTNQEDTAFSFTQHASIAQWIKWDIQGTRKDWFVRQPGLYYSDGIMFTVTSNNDVTVAFSDFADLADSATVPTGTQNSIETWYSLDGSDVSGGIGGKPANWIRASELNALEPDALIGNSNPLHYGQKYELWTAIQVEPSNNSGEYENTGTVTLTLQNVKTWVNPTDGQFK